MTMGRRLREGRLLGGRHKALVFSFPGLFLGLLWPVKWHP